MRPIVETLWLLLGAAVLLSAGAARSPLAKRAFLQAQLPLSIVVTTPVELIGATADPVSVSGRQAITVVFSRPVIALGSDFGDASATKKVPFRLSCSVPGKSRWVTTTIFRFDPDVDWPTDLNCNLTWTAGLSTYDGAPLALGSVPVTRSLVTYPLTLSIGGVLSDLATNLTDGLWNPSTAPTPEVPFEVPPDGARGAAGCGLGSSRVVACGVSIAEGPKGTGPAVSFGVGPCQTAAPWIYGMADSATTTPAGLSLDVNTTCAEVVPTSPLKPNTSYLLRLPRGAVYSALAGPLRMDTSAAFGGLVPYRRLDLWLRHGLSTSAEDLATSIHICAPSNKTATCTDLAFGLSLVSRGKARLSVPDLAPGTQYRISVDQTDAVKDGFGQSLQASALTFWTAYVSYAFVTPDTPASVAVLEAGADGLASWPLVTHAPPPPNPWNGGWQPNYASSLSSWELDLSSDKIKSLVVKGVAQSYLGYMDLEALFGAPASRLDVPLALRSPGSGAGWAELQLPLGSAEGPSRARLVAACCDWRGKAMSPKLVLNSSLSLSIVLGGGSITAWVLDTAAGGGVAAGATVSIFSQPYDGYNSADPVLFAACTTNEDGICVVSALAKDPYTLNLAAFASAGGQFAFLPASGWTRQPEYAPSAFVGSLVADRAVIVPGDSLKVTGFVQSVSLDGLQLPATTYAVLEINGTTGSMHGEIPVPTDARMQKYAVSLRIPTVRVTAMDGNGVAVPLPLGPVPDVAIADGWEIVPYAALGFTVADPRPPTAELKVEVPPWVLPTAAITVQATAISYIGASVKDASISVVWRSSKASGLLTLVTDASGAASATIDLGSLPAANRSAVYDTVTLGAEWIGPTRERITQAASVKIADGPAQLAMQLSLTPDTPGIGFAVAATLTSNVDGSEIKGAPVTVTLRPAPNDPGAGATCADTPSCSTTAGAGFLATCQLALPCVGRFELKACAVVPGSAQPACVNQTLGRNASEWAAAPLSKHPEPSLTADKSTYAQGEQAKLVFQSPWPAARLLLLWGNNRKMVSMVVNTLPASSLFEVSIPLGAECAGGCVAFAVLSVPRLSAAQLPLPSPNQLPVSHLFDPRAPHLHTMTLALNVKPPNSLGVAVAVAAEAGGPTVLDVDGEEVVAIEPGAQAQITVTVTSAPGSDAAPLDPVEVTVYAVDEAFLDLLPYPLPQPEQDMVLRLAAEVYHFGTSAYLLAPGAVRAVYDKLMARLTGQDPWLPVETSVGTGASGAYLPYGYYQSRPNIPAVDVNDTNYLAAFSTALTQLPMAADLSGGGADMMAGMNDAAAKPAPAPAPSGAKNAATTTTTTTSVSVRSSSEFVVTPLFTAVAADAAGLATVTFTAPQNLGAFVIRAFASCGAAAKYGAAEGRLAVRRRLSLTPSVPRFVRVGDVFEAGVVVTVGSAPATISVVVLVEDADSSPLTLTGTTTKAATFAPGGGLQQEVRFSFSAAAIGTATLTFSASDGQPGGATDALKLTVPVEGKAGQQGDVWVATSFAIPPVDDTALVQWQEGMDLPSAVPGSGGCGGARRQGGRVVMAARAEPAVPPSWDTLHPHSCLTDPDSGLSLTAGVGYFPALASLYDNLLGQSEDDSTYPYGQLAMLWATLPAVWSYYGQASSAAQGAAVAKGFTDLAKLTHPSYGLQWTDYARWSSWSPSRADLDINTWALWLAAEHGAAAASSAGFGTEWATLAASSVPLWRAAVEQQIVVDAQQAQYAWDGVKGSYSDWHTLAWVRLVLGGDWVPMASDSIHNDLSLDKLINNSKSLARETRVVLSLVLQQMGDANPAPALVNATVMEVTSALRETRPSVVTFSYMRLTAGTSSVTIRAVAASVGTFVLPPIRASADDQPELMGLTAGGKFTVCAGCAGPTYGSPPPPPKPCPRDCNGNGVCNLKTGKCQCDPAFRKSDCSSVVA
ncbi:hypothetical protein TSOC_000852 [Tetrabaena socialis]|uniref:Alpha-2-macroglobulin domain-containing protein n=2 Tax=Tetrabaena socialis TaxID=47790 RepID=A0A2J8AI83_9CHLO|nr:hypothetical protein TSOC_000852 [Tetrabaena socialis]|eukprot:PNH12233.1 hypothetical protein TSOC_000852 [Tetrabaena socialis]